MRVSVVIPAFNEAKGVAQTTANLLLVLNVLQNSYKTEIIFVDDGSTDDTRPLLQSAWNGDETVKIVAHEQNRGLGAALRTGFSYATGDIVVTTDFDGTYAFELIPTIVEQLVRDEVDIVTASPYHPAGHVEGVPKYRLMFSYGASLLYRLLVKWQVHTWTALFRAYRRPVIEHVQFESNGFLAGTELLVYALQAGYTVSEFPATLKTRSFGQSNIKIARVTRSHLIFQLKILRRRLKNLFQRPSP
ncbi:MAG: glycosyltransferase family 2 protein [Chloroflexi bacterium]|nr:glycosyltransferase family 2 protein [Chloroflexota bacterium]